MGEQQAINNYHKIALVRRKQKKRPDQSQLAWMKEREAQMELKMKREAET